LFGETVTVSGLLGGQDVLDALPGRDLGDAVCLPRAMLDDAGERTLDDLTLDDLSQRLDCPTIVADHMNEVWDALAHLAR
jgi:NifB/MoaA-like Fe-S oxidoreductase